MLSQRSVFYQTCPVCGRSLRMNVDAFGRRVTCVHCGGELRATGGEPPPQATGDEAASDRADTLPAVPLSFVEDCFPATEYPAADFPAADFPSAGPQ